MKTVDALEEEKDKLQKRLAIVDAQLADYHAIDRVQNWDMINLIIDKSAGDITIKSPEASVGNWSRRIDNKELAKEIINMVVDGLNEQAGSHE